MSPCVHVRAEIYTLPFGRLFSRDCPLYTVIVHVETTCFMYLTKLPGRNGSLVCDPRVSAWTHPELKRRFELSLRRALYPNYTRIVSVEFNSRLSVLSRFIELLLRWWIRWEFPLRFEPTPQTNPHGLKSCHSGTNGRTWAGQWSVIEWFGWSPLRWPDPA